MLTKFPFYNQTIRNKVIAFGTLFSRISVVRKDSSDVTKQIIKVPLAYGNKQKWFVRLRDDVPDLGKEISFVGPKISFEIVGMNYANGRRLNPINKTVNTKDGMQYRQYTPAPWNLYFNLYVIATYQEDILQIFEQIVPYFSPGMNIVVNEDARMDQKSDCKIVLNSVTLNDNFDTTFNDNRAIIYTLQFMMETNFYGPVSGRTDPEHHFDGDGDDGGLHYIKKVIVKEYGPDQVQITEADGYVEDDYIDHFTIDEYFENLYEK